MTTDPTDATLRDILQTTRTIAIVGLSPKPQRPSHSVACYLAAQGYRVIPVNPGQVGAEFQGEAYRATLSDLAGIDVDMIDIFRRSDAVPAIVQEALVALPGLRTVWMQIGVRHADAAKRAEDAGCRVVQDRCTKIEHRRLLAMTGPGTG